MDGFGRPNRSGPACGGIKEWLVEEAITHSLPRIHEIPFDARRKRMSTIHQVHRQDASFPEVPAGQQVAFVKGAPHEVLLLCTHIRMHGEVIPLDDSWRARFYPPTMTIRAMPCVFWRWHIRRYPNASGAIPPREWK